MNDDVRCSLHEGSHAAQHAAGGLTDADIDSIFGGTLRPKTGHCYTASHQ